MTGVHGHPSLVNTSVVRVVRFERREVGKGEMLFGWVHPSLIRHSSSPSYSLGATYSTFESVALYKNIRSSRILWQYPCIVPYNFANNQPNTPSMPCASTSSTYLTRMDPCGASIST